MDRIDKKILTLLHRDARITMKALSEQVHLSQPGCAERVRKLVERGVIEGYSVRANPAALGYPITAIVRVRPLPGRQERVEALLAEIAEVVHCDKVTGKDAFHCRLQLRSIEQLDACLGRIAQFATTSTSIVKSSPVAERLPPLGDD